jgi:H+/Cl- antiporter ClcA
MNREPDFFQNLQAEFSNARQWIDRAVVLSYAVIAGLFVVAFTLLSEWTVEVFEHVYTISPWLTLLWTPALTAGIVWLTRSFFQGASGSGIPQVMAALTPGLNAAGRERFVSLRLTFAKIGLSSLGLLAGLSVGREGPSVQVAAGIMQHARRWLRPDSNISVHALLVAGGSAGIAAAFNAPLAGVVFAIEELSRTLESRSSGLIIAAIVLAGLMGVSMFGNVTYFGVIKVPPLVVSSFLEGLVVTVLCGALGGLFSRVMADSLTGRHADRFCLWRKRWPIRFAAVVGLSIAIMGIVTHGDTSGSGSAAVHRMLAGDEHASWVFVVLKFMSTWLTAWCGAPGGIFAPSLSIGASVGHNIAALSSPELAPALIAVGMASFLAAVTQAPLTSFIIVMEMVDGRAMVLSLMAAAMLASLISRMISRPLYGTLADFMLLQLKEQPSAAAPSGPSPAPATPSPAPHTPETGPESRPV